MVKQRVTVPFPEEKSAAVWWYSDYYAFAEESILAFAPGESGVYGLYGSGQQIFIGESENIREALLRHFKNNDFESEHDRPTSFMFEICANELRAQRMQDLKVKYQPTLQLEPRLDDSWSFVSGQETSEPFSFDAIPEDQFDVPNNSLPVESRAVERKRFSLSLGKVVALGAILAFSVALSFHFEILGGNSIKKTANAGFEFAGKGTPNDTAADGLAATAPAWRPPASSTAMAKESPAESIESGHEAEPQGKIAGIDHKATAAPAKHETSAVAADLRIGRRNGHGELAPAGARDRARSSVASTSGRGTAWTVQVGASTEKDLVVAQVAGLKAKGFDAYMAEAELSGQIWYRVRVGVLKTRSEAETLRQTLESQEGYRTPYVTID